MWFTTKLFLMGFGMLSLCLLAPHRIYAWGLAQNPLLEESGKATKSLRFLSFAGWLVWLQLAALIVGSIILENWWMIVILVAIVVVNICLFRGVVCKFLDEDTDMLVDVQVRADAQRRLKALESESKDQAN